MAATSALPEPLLAAPHGCQASALNGLSGGVVRTEAALHISLASLWVLQVELDVPTLHAALALHEVFGLRLHDAPAELPLPSPALALRGHPRPLYLAWRVALRLETLCEALALDLGSGPPITLCFDPRHPWHVAAVRGHILGARLLQEPLLHQLR